MKVWIDRESNASVRDWVIADDPEAVDRPSLKTAFRPTLARVYARFVCGRYVAQPGEQVKAGALYGVLRYAWHLDETVTALIISTASDDLGALVDMVPDVDAFARGIYLVDREGNRLPALA